MFYLQRGEFMEGVVQETGVATLELLSPVELGLKGCERKEGVSEQYQLSSPGEEFCRA